MSDETNVAYVEVFAGEDDMYYWHGKADNGEVVTTSEGYTRKEDAERAAGDTFPGVELRHT